MLLKSQMLQVINDVQVPYCISLCCRDHLISVWLQVSWAGSDRKSGRSLVVGSPQGCLLELLCAPARLSSDSHSCPACITSCALEELFLLSHSAHISKLMNMHRGPPPALPPSALSYGDWKKQKNKLRSLDSFCFCLLFLLPESVSKQTISSCV